MNKWGKILIGAGAITGIGFLTKVARTSSQLETVTTAKVHKLDLAGLTIRVDAQLKNPTRGTLTIKYPFIKLIYEATTIGTSQSINKDIEIPSYGQAKIEAIMINVPLLSLLSIGTALYKALKSGSGVKVKVVTISTINLGFWSRPYEKATDIILKK